MRHKNIWSLRGESGAAPLVMALVVAGGIVGGVKIANFVAEQSLKSQKRTVSKFYLQMANEAALALTSQLAGNSIIVPNKAGSGFEKNKDLDTKTGSRVRGGGTHKNWELKGNTLQITNCLKPDITNSDVFVDRDNTDILKNESSNCIQGFDITTTVEVVAKLDTPDVNNVIGKNSTESYFQVKATTEHPEDSSIKLARDARIRHNDPSRLCSSENGEICNVDHCRFMKPLRNTDGNVMYKANGKMHLMPNPEYAESMTLSVNVANYTVKKMHENDPTDDPEDLQKFLDEAYKDGRKNPFKKPQGVKGKMVKEDLVQTNSDGEVTLNIGHVDNNMVEFEGFLFDNQRKGANAFAWPPGESYEMIRDRLKDGCKRTLGTSEPDFCSRISFPYETQEYHYSQYKNCSYYGPDRIPRRNDIDGRISLDAGLDDYEKRASLVSYSDWKPTASTNEGMRVIKDNRTKWVDQDCHSDFTDSKKSEVDNNVCHDFSGIREGVVEVEEIRSETVALENTCKKYDNEQACKQEANCQWLEAISKSKNDDDDDKNKDKSNQGSLSGECTMVKSTSNVFQRRVRSYEWKTECEYKDAPANAGTKNDLTVCFYLEYFDIMDRNNCRRETSSRICRNNNGCFIAGTEIKMADGRIKNIEDLKEGEFVYNPSTQAPAEVESVIVGNQKRELYKIFYSDRSVTATYNHPFATSAGFKDAIELKVGDYIITESLDEVKIQKIERLPIESGRLVWNLKLKQTSGSQTVSLDQHTFVANGLATGDFFIQGASRKKLKELSKAEAESQDFIRFLQNKGMLK
ncbi:Hint domain-containing protein [Pseudobacteriovorax antillogorgiicola]|uniref:Intein N-terminal splicing region n=1 Tax=Pseudobacteriovorax antillogorgiicola TaxID=1513793 RepID=A0A1Y6BQZ2_9BACT|nr:Hint domain-containing protein [Pseudobacteriovorax antillogorgiicola]TCS53757.1 intein [Pseudobacteriovorax antillogorgiicola]SMF22541.1 intein N-terminal splicing region [Pseudobacteriovorax antillogorgiicola]